jgi:glycerol uptake facilitator-like aquaporin
VIYLLVQLAGAVAAALVIKLVLNEGGGSLNAANAANFGAPTIRPKRSSIVSRSITTKRPPSFPTTGIGVC